MGGLAQLGEHLLCKQRVNGSIPLSSTTYKLSSFGILNDRKLESPSVASGERLVREFRNKRHRLFLISCKRNQRLIFKKMEEVKRLDDKDEHVKA